MTAPASTLLQRVTGWFGGLPGKAVAAGADDAIAFLGQFLFQETFAAAPDKAQRHVQPPARKRREQFAFGGEDQFDRSGHFGPGPGQRTGHQCAGHR